MKYEDRHLELREAVAQHGAAWREGDEDGAEVIVASRRLDAFHERTGPPVDDLVAAVREEGHYGSCSRLGKGGECDCPMRFVAALDEEADLPEQLRRMGHRGPRAARPRGGERWLRFPWPGTRRSAQDAAGRGWDTCPKSVPSDRKARDDPARRREISTSGGEERNTTR